MQELGQLKQRLLTANPDAKFDSDEPLPKLGPQREAVQAAEGRIIQCQQVIDELPDRTNARYDEPDELQFAWMPVTCHDFILQVEKELAGPSEELDGLTAALEMRVSAKAQLCKTARCMKQLRQSSLPQVDPPFIESSKLILDPLSGAFYRSKNALFARRHFFSRNARPHQHACPDQEPATLCGADCPSLRKAPLSTHFPHATPLPLAWVAFRCPPDPSSLLLGALNGSLYRRQPFAFLALRSPSLAPASSCRRTLAKEVAEKAAALANESRALRLAADAAVDSTHIRRQDRECVHEPNLRRMKELMLMSSVPRIHTKVAPGSGEASPVSERNASKEAKAPQRSDSTSSKAAGGSVGSKAAGGSVGPSRSRNGIASGDASPRLSPRRPSPRQPSRIAACDGGLDESGTLFARAEGRLRAITPDEVTLMADELGISMRESNPEFFLLWIAVEALCAPLPSMWTPADGGGYEHAVTRQFSEKHPLLPVFKEAVTRERRLKERFQKRPPPP